jgi:hypothetical protein
MVVIVGTSHLSVVINYNPLHNTYHALSSNLNKKLTIMDGFMNMCALSC